MRIRDWIVPAAAAWLAIIAMAFDRPYLWTPAMLMFIPWFLLKLWRLRAAARIES